MIPHEWEKQLQVRWPAGEARRERTFGAYGVSVLVAHDLTLLGGSFQQPLRLAGELASRKLVQIGPQILAATSEIAELGATAAAPKQCSLALPRTDAPKPMVSLARRRSPR